MEIVQWWECSSLIWLAWVWFSDGCNNIWHLNMTCMFFSLFWKSFSSSFSFPSPTKTNITNSNGTCGQGEPSCGMLTAKFPSLFPFLFPSSHSHYLNNFYCVTNHIEEQDISANYKTIIKNYFHCFSWFSNSSLFFLMQWHSNFIDSLNSFLCFKDLFV